MGIGPRKGDEQNSAWFRDTNGSLNLSKTTRSRDSQQIEKKLPNSGLCYFGWPPGKTERKWKGRKVSYYRTEIKLRSMKVMVIPIVIATLGPVSKGFVPELEDSEIRVSVETLQHCWDRPEY